MLATADAKIACQGGLQLAVHSQVLSLASPVLELAFQVQREGAAGQVSQRCSAVGARRRSCLCCLGMRCCGCCRRRLKRGVSAQ